MKIDALQMVREARDRISREISGMTPSEEIEYFRKGAQEFEARMKRNAPGREAGEAAPAGAAISAKSGSDPD